MQVYKGCCSVFGVVVFDARFAKRFANHGAHRCDRGDGGPPSIRLITRGSDATNTSSIANKRSR